MGPGRHGWLILGGCMALGAGGLAAVRAESGTGPQLISATVPRLASEVERSRGGATRYQHDDGDFRQGTSAADSWVAEYAVRYVLRSGGAIRWLEACFSLYDIAAVQDYAFDFVVYSDETRTIWNEGSQQYDRGSRPGDVLSGPERCGYSCPFHRKLRSSRASSRRWTCQCPLVRFGSVFGCPAGARGDRCGFPAPPLGTICTVMLELRIRLGESATSIRNRV